jgi:exoribonuclease II
LPIESSSASLDNLLDESRRDLTHLPAFAIDDEGSQDPDDALSWDNGRIWVHIADAAALIKPDSPADIEARARGANLYLPEGTVLMLPAQATQMLALGLNDISPALSFGFETNDEGEIIDLEITPSWVRVTRMSYEEAELHLEESPLCQLLQAAHNYEKRRMANGAVDIDLPEVKVRVENDTVMITPLPNLQSRDLVREAMLMTGEAVAKFATEHNIPIPFSIQDEPVGELPAEHSPSAMFALRRLLKPSQKSSIAGKHHGLGMELYTQATSPLRRYLDLIVHQQLRSYLHGQAVMESQTLIKLIGSTESIMREVRFVERKSNQHWKWVFLIQHPEWSGEGIVVEKRGKRHTILVPQLDIDTSLYPSGDLALDSGVSLAVSSVDLVNLEASFR